jgi:hypothetical protein
VTAAEAPLGLNVRMVAGAFAPDAGTGVVALEVSWARVDFAPGSALPAWVVGESPVAQAPDGLWLGDGLGALRFLPADHRVPMTGLTAPGGWLSAFDRTNSAQIERPVLFPSVPSGGGVGLPGLNWGVDTSTALVPVLQNGTPQLLQFRAPPDAGFVEVKQGFLRARRGAEQFFWPLPP